MRVEPILIFSISPLFRVNPGKGEIVAAMVKNGIEHDPNVPFVAFGY